MTDQQTNNFGDINAGIVNFGTMEVHGNITVTYVQSPPLPRIGAAAATFCTNARLVPHLAEHYIGYQAQRDDIHALIAAHKHVLIRGFGGAGKTTLASQLAADWLDAARGNVLHLYVGDNDADKNLQALAGAFKQQNEVAAAEGNAKQAIVQRLIVENNVSLVVFDDAWNPAGLTAALQAVPPRTAVMVTSRNAYPIRDQVELQRLAPDDALALLKFHAAEQNTDDGGKLCERLAYLPYAIKLAGMQMHHRALSAAQLLATLDSPYTLKAPAEFGESEGRLSLAMLIQTSLDALDADARRAFSALGAFWDVTITPELLTLYFAQTDAALNAAEPLDTLHFRGLVTRIPEDAENVRHTITHDLAHEYAAAQNSDAERGHALAACLALIKAHNKPSIPNFNALMPLLDQFDGAQTWAEAQSRWADVERFGWDLMGQGSSAGIIMYRGLYLRGIGLLGRAVAAAQARGDRYNESSHLIMQAACYEKTAQYPAALEAYGAALAIDEAAGDKQGVAITLGNMGGVYQLQKRYDDAINTFEQALVIMRELGNKSHIAATLGNLAIVYQNQGDYERAVSGYQEAIALYQGLGDEQKAALHLGNLGNCYTAMGQYDDARRALTDALATHQRLGNTAEMGYNHAHLGYLEETLKNYPAALRHYEQSLAIRRKIGNPEHIQWTEDAIARVRGLMG
jgi:tetratricopeptide (TPR) repeat protein